jgi:hypothetical protein
MSTSSSNDVTISLSILLGIASVTLGVCSLVNASRCDKIDILWGCVKFERSKQKKHDTQTHDDECEDTSCDDDDDDKNDTAIMDKV